MELASFNHVWEPLITWQFLTASMFIIAVMTGIKRTLVVYNPKLLDNRNVAAFLTAGNMILGFIVALPKGFLAGDTYFERMFTGMVAGFSTHFVYHLLLKRFGVFGANTPKGKDADDDDEIPPAPQAKAAGG